MAMECAFDTQLSFWIIIVLFVTLTNHFEKMF